MLLYKLIYIYIYIIKTRRIFHALVAFDKINTHAIINKGKITIYLPKFGPIFNSISNVSIFTVHLPNFQIFAIQPF